MKKLSALKDKIIKNHQSLINVKEILKNKPDKYDMLKLELMVDSIFNTLIDLSAYIIVKEASDNLDEDV